MYCPDCGKSNPQNSSYCQHCGIKLEGSSDEFKETSKNSIEPPREQGSEKISSDKSPYPYIISINKLVFLSIATFGLYEIYWFYKHFKSFKTEDNWKISPLARAIFATAFSYSLFKHVSEKVIKLDKNMGLNPIGLAVLFLILLISSSLGDYYWIISMFSFIPLIPVQNAINFYWTEKYGGKVEKSNLGTGNLLIAIIGGFLVLLSLYGIFLPDETATPTTPSTTTPQTSYNQEEIVSSVVNILCPSIIEGEEGVGGSGTIISEDGLILTNSHIIPQDEKYINVDEVGCMVILPNPTTGQPEGVYLANPIVLPEISDKYDLAYMSIYAAYYDEKTREYQGSYPRTFPAFDDSSRCVDEAVKLGEKVTIFGYPAISGGYSLTITEGVVSSFPGEGLVVTSAKISQGNSGGLAVDEKGCMIGIPSMISSDEYESLGVIISADLINQFTDEVTELVGE